MRHAPLDCPDGVFVLLLLTIALVIVGAVSLFIGFVSNSLLPIYISIGCSIVAGIVLVVFSRMSRRQPAPAEPATARTQPAWADRPSVPASTAPQPRPQPAPTYEPEPAVVGAAGGSAAAAAPLRLEEEMEEDEDFPIEDYDRLRVNQILPALTQLDLDELDMVRAREVQGKGRTTVLNRLDDLIEDRELEAEADTAVGEVVEPLPEPVPVDEVVEPLPEPVPVDEDADFPIADYDQLTVDEILDQLDDLDEDELDMVADREEAGLNRATILDRIDDIFDEIDAEMDAAGAPPPVVSEPVKAAKKAPAKKAAKKAPAKKAAKKAPAKKAPAKKAPAKKAPAQKAPAPAKKAPAKKAPAPAKKAPAKKAPAPAKKAPAKKAPAPAKKAPAKKAAKKASAKKGAAKKA